MAGLIAVVVLVGVLCVLNLLLTFGVIRRLREHGELIAKGGNNGPRAPELSIGTQVTEFSGTTTEDEPVSRDLLSGETLVAFLKPGCEPCEERLPDFATTAGSWPGGRQSTLAVVVGEPAEAENYIQALGPVSRVVVEPLGGPVASAFGVQGYPLFGVIDSSGTVLRSTMTPTELRVLAA